MFARIILCMLIYYSLAAPLYNSFRRRCTTGETPFLLIYDRQACLPVDLMYGTKSTGTSVSGYEKELGLKLFNRLEKEKYATIAERIV